MSLGAYVKYGFFLRCIARSDFAGFQVAGFPKWLCQRILPVNEGTTKLMNEEESVFVEGESM